MSGVRVSHHPPFFPYNVSRSYAASTFCCAAHETVSAAPPLHINGDDVSNTGDKPHGFRTYSEEVNLEPGTYGIEVRYVENHGHAGLKLEWDGPDTDGREVMQADPGLSVPKDDAIQVGIQVSHASDQANVTLEGLPANTLIISGEHSVITNGDPVDLSGCNLNHLELSPPVGFEGVIHGQIVVSDIDSAGTLITSENPFALTVGDDPVSPGISLDEELAYEALHSSTPGTLPWDAIHSTDNAPEVDVLDEPISTLGDANITCIETDTYERFDW